MKRLYATADPAEREALRALLREAGIESSLDDGGGILVGNEDAPKAAEVLAAHFEKLDPRDTPPPAEVKPSGWLARLLRRLTGK